MQPGIPPGLLYPQLRLSLKRGSSDGEASTFAAIHETSDFEGCDQTSKKKVRTELERESVAFEETDENCDPNVEATFGEIYESLIDTAVLRQIKEQYDSFHQRMYKTYSTKNFCYVTPSTRRKKNIGGSKYGDAVLPVKKVSWIDLADPPVVAFDTMLFATKNLHFCPLTFDKGFDKGFENVFAVLQGSYSSKASAVSICHLASVCVNHNSAPYYLQLDKTTMGDNPYQYLFPGVSEEEANCEVISVNDHHLKAEVLLLRTTRPVPIGQKLNLAKAHSVEHITFERKNGRKLFWFQDVCVSDLLVDFNLV